MTIARVKIETVNVGETKTGSKNGKDWTLWPIGLKINDKWVNGAVFNQDEVTRLQEASDKGEVIALDFFQDEYNGQKQNKFRFPKKIDELEDRIAKLEKAVYGNNQPTPQPPKQEWNAPPQSDDDLPF